MAEINPAQPPGPPANKPDFKQFIHALRHHKWFPFGAGFLGWFAVNGIFWIWQITSFKGGSSAEFGAAGIGLCTLPLNLILLLSFAIVRKTRRLALGMLSAVVLNFAISLLIGLSTNAICLAPFFAGKLQ